MYYLTLLHEFCFVLCLFLKKSGGKYKNKKQKKHMVQNGTGLARAMETNNKFAYNFVIICRYLNLVKLANRKFKNCYNIKILNGLWPLSCNNFRVGR
jgi:hypothetical protein